jgi:hypothetical protein
MAIVLIALPIVMLCTLWTLQAEASMREPAAWPHWPVL